MAEETEADSTTLPKDMSHYILKHESALYGEFLCCMEKPNSKLGSHAASSTSFETAM